MRAKPYPWRVSKREATVTVLTPEGFDVERAVRARYSGAAKAREADLCCPTSYDPRLLKAIPEEVIARDYGCGDPSPHLREGETVLESPDFALKSRWSRAIRSMSWCRTAS